MFRTPAFRGQLDAMATMVQASLEGEVLSDAVKQQTRHLDAAEKIDMMSSMANQFAPMIRDGKRWTFAHLAAPKLVLSDNPLGITDPNPRPEQGTGLFSTETVEVTLPLTPSCCLTLHHDPALPMHLDLGDSSHVFAEMTNYVTARHGVEWVYASSEHLLRWVAIQAPSTLQPRPFGDVAGLDPERVDEANADARRHAARSRRQTGAAESSKGEGRANNRA
jgi:hypothetical protein